MKHVNTRWFFILTIVLLSVTLACSAGAPRGDRSQAGSQENEARATINVVAEDFSFSLADSQLKSGTVTFAVKNDGSMPHDFAIRGQDVDQKTPTIKPGESANLTVELEPGTYTYVCTIGGHEQLGMRGTFTVTSD